MAEKERIEASETGEVRVRFAPSPTGALHIGGARTAYFNWLFARKYGGKFVLRIDDTDSARSTEESYRQILDSLSWLGMDWDEGPDVGGTYGPYRQSQRMELYKKRLKQLLAEDKVYPCFCTSDQLQQDREQALQEGKTPRYSGRCRHLSKAEQDERIRAGDPCVYRLRGPRDGAVTVRDLIRGEVSFAASEVDDFIVWKADGTPTYHFASCIDDAAMRITHIIRAEEHLSNTPRHVVLFEALGEGVPQFAHVPMILAPDRSKLSKRHGATSVQEYREAGILPEALVNYLLLLGFSPGDDNEVLDRNRAVELFDIRHVAKHAAIYDVKKLEWLNGYYMRNRPEDQLLVEIWPELQRRGWVKPEESKECLAWLQTIVQRVSQRATSLNHLVENMTYFFEDVAQYDEKGLKKHFGKAGVVQRLQAAAESLDQVNPFIAPMLEKHYRNLIAKWGIKGGELIHPTRLAITGLTAGPGLFDVMALLGREQCKVRMSRAASFAQQHALIK